MDTQGKLEMLADASRYDLACACGTKGGPDHRTRSAEGMWLYPVSLPSGGTSIMLKTLMSNVCTNDCRYCPFREQRDIPRCVLQPEEIATVFLEYVRRLKIMGLFLSSGVMRDPDHTMDRLIATARLLRKRYAYRGYIHLKIIPGASPAAIEEAMSLASAVSLNVEAPKRSAFQALSSKKDFDRDIVAPMKLISALAAKDGKFSRVRTTTQFVVGASTESDRDIIQATEGLYGRLGLQRVYYSAYQRGQGDPSLPGEQESAPQPQVLLTREHRLYQTDFLLRQYGFKAEEIPLLPGGRLDLAVDPKQGWADAHPERFPVRLRNADRDELLRVPGLGPVSVKRILQLRREGGLRSLRDVGLKGTRLALASRYVVVA